MKFYRLNKKSGTPWYAMYPVGGHLLHYQFLASKVPVSMWGTTASGIDDGLAPLTSVEAIANDFITSLPHASDSYNLIGYCFGCLTALEITRLIKVTNLILIDPIVNYTYTASNIDTSVPENYRQVRINNGIACENYIKNTIPSYLKDGKPYKNIDNVIILDRDSNKASDYLKQNLIDAKNILAIMQTDLNHTDIVKSTTTMVMVNQFISDVLE